MEGNSANNIEPSKLADVDSSNIQDISVVPYNSQSTQALKSSVTPRLADFVTAVSEKNQPEIRKSVVNYELTEEEKEVEAWTQYMRTLKSRSKLRALPWWRRIITFPFFLVWVIDPLGLLNWYFGQRRTDESVKLALGKAGDDDDEMTESTNSDNPIFQAIKQNQESIVLELMKKYPIFLHQYQWTSPLLVAFLNGHYELGKSMLVNTPSLVNQVDYRGKLAGQNVLHIAIINRKPKVALWLIEQYQKYLMIEVWGYDFELHSRCYLGGTPLLFAIALGQLNVALAILNVPINEAATMEEIETMKRRHKDERKRRVYAQVNASKSPVLFDLADTMKKKQPSVLKVLPVLQQKLREKIQIGSSVNQLISFEQQTEEDMAEWNEMIKNPYSIFYLDRFQNNALHLAVLQDQVLAYDFAVGYAMAKLLPNGVVKEDNEQDYISHEGIPQYLDRVDDKTRERMVSFLMHPNRDGLTPLALAATLGSALMFTHILEKFSIPMENFGVFQNVNVPLLDLDLPVSKTNCFSAIECLCESEKPLSTTLLNADNETMQEIYQKRFQMLEIEEVRTILDKKWNYVGRQWFYRLYTLYIIYLVALRITLFTEKNFRIYSIETFTCCILAGAKLLPELKFLVFDFRKYMTQSGAGKLDSILTLAATGSFVSCMIWRISHYDWQSETDNQIASVAVITGWLFNFYFFLGFETTGPFIVMIVNMIAHDMMRFFLVFGVVVAGFAQAHVLLTNGSRTFMGFLTSFRSLVVAGIVGEVNYSDSYAKESGFTQGIIWIYIGLVLILLLNLLIAMMGNTYEDIMAQSKQRWIAERSNIMDSITNLLSEKSIRLSRMSYSHSIERKSRKGKLERYFTVEKMRPNKMTEKEDKIETMNEVKTDS